ncbi:HrpF/NolX family T3SS translocon protein [Trinickia caryophylli]|uniref:Type III secretion translocon protein HrpF n=1 Tax=Trinickia caryophylli TaxID=28094 RepID=A0A1X7D648_TRICW|nr:HrpF/NolX family T3SS translocon protein [Trinickia caryophylli]PMS12706.1 nodulation protein NOLX [Trinickia caryophylli]TRX15111.1 nodulation protein NOLX [Trinickia caryophylli]WQE14972.1 HrpF/NolX family T3SS translocon protein [Trinickia caryophylli]SMF09341.1 type III secretion translocon protein HrpF [Trinickia caryophylli]GLU31299.1 nodulation outer protein X [Trinickia caryophylli]
MSLNTVTPSSSTFSTSPVPTDTGGTQQPVDDTSARINAQIDSMFSSSLSSLVGNDSDPDSTITHSQNDQQSSAAQDASTPQQQQSTVTWNGGTLTDQQLQIVSVLDRHKDQCPLEIDNLDAKINDPSTPPDLKAALQGLQQDPQLAIAIGSQGDGRCGGKIKAKDLEKFSENHPQVAQFNEQQAKSYVNNYIPSDGSSNGKPQVMTESDALRELYKYSENLPKKIDQDQLKQIVDGDAKTGKTPPQVIAAAQYFRDHQDAWNKLSGDGRMSRSDIEEAAASSMHLTQRETKTLDTMKANQNAFFGSGDLTRDKLSSMVNDKHLDKGVRDAAKQLLNDPVLFGMLNNSITGYKTHHGFFSFGGGHTVDSGNISGKDFQHFLDNMTPANKDVQKPQTHEPKTDAEKSAVVDMMMGTADQPDIKTPKHNGGFLQHALDDALKIGSKVLDWEATALSALSFIPAIGEVADAASMAIESESQAMNVLHAAISGGNVKQALEEAGLSLAAQAVGDMAGPEAKLAMKEGLTKKVLEKAANQAIDIPVSVAKDYTENYLGNLKTRIEMGPLQEQYNQQLAMLRGDDSTFASTSAQIDAYMANAPQDNRSNPYANTSLAA